MNYDLRRYTSLIKQEMWQQEFKLVFTAYGAQFQDWGVCATFFRISSSRLDFVFFIISDHRLRKAEFFCNFIIEKYPIYT